MKESAKESLRPTQRFGDGLKFRRKRASAAEKKPREEQRCDDAVGIAAPLFSKNEKEIVFE